MLVLQTVLTIYDLTLYVATLITLYTYSYSMYVPTYICAELAML